MILFTGVAGSGKSLQGRKLADDKGYPWLSTGEFLRMVVAGEKRQQMLEGKLLPDQDVIAIVEKVFRLINVRDEFVLDGFPRTIQQAEWLHEYTLQHSVDFTVVIHMVAKESTAVNRLLSRGRQDDHEVAIKERFEEYQESIKPILEYFQSESISVVDIEAEAEPELIQTEIQEVLSRA